MCVVTYGTVIYVTVTSVVTDVTATYVTLTSVVTHVTGICIMQTPFNNSDTAVPNNQE